MKHERSIEQTEELASLYALGALSQHEARAFESHLRDGCAVCEQELASFDEVVGALSLAVPPAEPPARVRLLVDARIARETKNSAVPLSAERPRRLTSFLGWALAASLAAISILSVIAWLRAEQALTDRQNEVATLREASAELRDELSRESARSQEYEQILSTLKSPGSRIIPVVAGPKTAMPVAEVYWDRSASRWVITANLTPPPSGKVYQLWFVTASEKISAGLLETDRNGHGFTVIDVPRGLGDLKAVAITIEPSGGSPQPTTQPVAVGVVG